MSCKTVRNMVALATLGLCSHWALAGDDAPEVRVSGFGTLGYVTTDNGNAVFRSSVRQSTGAADGSGDWGVDSRLGVQADVKFNQTFSAVGQLLAMRRDGENSPKVEWLFGQARATDWADVRLGRMVLPTYMVSDSRNVGYASHWLRAPAEAYGFYPPSAFDGVQGVFRNTVGDTNLTVQLSAGKSLADIAFFNGQVGPTGAVLLGQVDYKRLYSMNLVAEQGNWLARFGYTVGSDTQVTLGGATVDQGKDKFTGLGLQYDNGSVLVMSEYVTRRWASQNTPALTGAFDTDGYYVSAGYRFGPVMPYVSLSSFTPKGIFFNATPGKGKTQAVGVRWDVMKNVAFKAQIEDTKGPVGTQILPINNRFIPTQSLRATSVAVDFVF